MKSMEKDIHILAASPVLRKKIEEGLKGIRAGRKISLDSYVRRRAKRNAKN